jgi:GMP synthase (glutamine-hydrolysing)
MPVKPLAIFKMGATYPELARKQGDFSDWVARGCGLDQARLTVVDAIGPPPLPATENLSGAILTGSHHYVTDREPWSESVADWIRRAIAAGLPLLGICYGHQLIAQAAGGLAGANPAGLEFGTVAVATAADAVGDPLFGALVPEFKAHTCHAQTVLRLPPGATLLAVSHRDAHQAFRLGATCWGVQFHPEFDETATGYYIDQYHSPLAAQGSDPEALRSRITPTPRSHGLLTAFTALADRGAAAP